MKTEQEYKAFEDRILPELTALIKAIIPDIEDDFKESEDDDPTIQLTIACDFDLTDWKYQTGDTSYYGNCYGYSHWGTNYVTRDCNPEELAKALLDEMLEDVAQCDTVS